MNNVMSDIVNVAKNDNNAFSPDLLVPFLHLPQRSFWPTTGPTPGFEDSCGRLVAATGLAPHSDTLPLHLAYMIGFGVQFSLH